MYDLIKTSLTLFAAPRGGTLLVNTKEWYGRPTVNMWPQVFDGNTEYYDGTGTWMSSKGTGRDELSNGVDRGGAV